MARIALPVFTRDHRTGLIKELPHVGPKQFASARTRASSPHLRVLVADDNDTHRRLTIWQLGEAWPFERDMVAECATNGDEALEKIRGNPYKLVVLDWKMPTMGGGEVLRSMRQNGVQIPVVVVSGMRRADIHEDIESLGAAFLNKDDLNPSGFRSAIAASIQLLGLDQ